MGALHDGHRALLDAARAECDTVVHEPLRQPGPVRRARRPRRLPARRGADLAARGATRASTSSSRPRRDEMYPPGYQTWVEVTELGAIARGRAPARALPRRRHRLPQALHDRPPRPSSFFGQKDAQQVDVRAADDRATSSSSSSSVVVPDRARRRRARALVAQRAALRRTSAARRWRFRARSRRATRRGAARARSRRASRSTTSRSRRSTHPSSPPPCASARPV